MVPQSRIKKKRKRLSSQESEQVLQSRIKKRFSINDQKGFSMKNQKKVS